MISTSDIVDIFDTVQKGGVIALLLIILIGGMRQWWVWGWLYRQEKQEKDQWRRLALQGTRHLEDATDTAETLAAKKGLL